MKNGGEGGKETDGNNQLMQNESLFLSPSGTNRNIKYVKLKQKHEWQNCFPLFLRAFYFEEWSHKVVKGKKSKGFPLSTNSLKCLILKKLFLSIHVSHVCLEQIALAVAVHTVGIIPHELEVKRYLTKPSTNQQSRTGWTSNCEYPPGLQEAEVAISSGFGGYVLCFVLF